MTDLISKCIGIDLTQNMPWLAVATGCEIAQHESLERIPPSTLLPTIQGESMIVGSDSHKHRRGIGTRWPPECQIPVGYNYDNGVGRIPLVCAWNKLASVSNHKFSGALGDTEIAWKPSGRKKICSSAEKIISESVLSWERRYSSTDSAIVIPDSLGEAAQQALVDNCKSFLIPRPIAVAMSWCRKNALNYSGKESSSSRGVGIGHLLVVTLSFDQWEVVPIEIRARIYQKKLWLIPIRNRVADGGGFPRIGVNFFLALAGEGEESLEQIWHTVFGSTKASDLINNKDLSKKRTQLIRECVAQGFCQTNKKLFQNLDAWKEAFSKSQQVKAGQYKEELLRLYKKQLYFLPNNVKNTCLGVIVDGACTSIPIAENNRSLGSFIASAFDGHKPIISDGREAAYGAAVTAYALKNTLPSYRETIIPIDIHYHGKDDQGDSKNAYKLLVEGKTVEAGSEYKSKVPVTGLKIKQGEDTLTLTLRRSPENDVFIYRKVTARIRNQTKFDEKVRIVAHLKPGQGFAKVFIESVNKGVFNTMLNWRSMEEVKEPPPPPLAYLPEVSRVEADNEMWGVAESTILEAIEALKQNSPYLVDILTTLRANKGLNQWPLADNRDAFRGSTPQGDIFRHYGVYPSDGDLSSIENPILAKEFAQQCSKRFVEIKTSVSERKQIQLAASWMYLACPPTILHKAQKCLKRNLAKTSPVDLNTIGLCWAGSKDIELFFKAFELRLRQGTTGVNNWLRACRNIVRFRDAALHPTNIPRKRMDRIFNSILSILEGQIEENNFNQIFLNCILTCLYLLKRRRYEQDFLNNGSSASDRLKDILENLIKSYSMELNKQKKSIVKVTLKFLEKEASLNDLDSSVLTG